MLEQIDHVAIAVENLEEAIALYESVFHLEVRGREGDEAQGFEMATFQVGESTIELLAPITKDSAVGRFLAKRGPGIHHIAFRVRDVQESLRQCEERGLAPIDKQPRRGTGGTSIVFLHPSSTMGSLIELVESAD